MMPKKSQAIPYRPDGKLNTVHEGIVSAGLTLFSLEHTNSNL